MKLIFFEFPVEVDSFLVFLKERNLKLSDFYIVALSLNVQVYLKKCGINFSNTLKYFNNDSHKNCLFQSNLIVEFMENALSLNNNPENIEGYKDWHVFCVRHIVNYFLWVIEIGSNAISDVQISRVYAVVQQHDYDFTGPLIKNSEMYLGRIIEFLAIKNNLPVTIIPLKNKRVSFPQKNRLKYKNVKKYNFEELRKHKILLIPSLSYNLHHVCSKIKSWDPKIRVVYIHDEPLSFHRKLFYKFFKNVNYFVGLHNFPDSTCPSIEEDLKRWVAELEANKLVFAYKGINFWTQIKSKVSIGITGDTKNLAQKSHKLLFLIRNISPDLTLSYSSRHITYVLGELCRNEGLEALCISHGTVVPPKNDVEVIVNRNIGKSVILNRYPSVAVQTPWCEKYLEYYPHSSKEIITGPLVLRNNIKKRKKNEKKLTILHAVTLKSRASLKFWGVEHHDEFISSLTDLIKITSRIEEVHLIIRLHPAFANESDSGEIRQLLPKSDSYSLSCSGSIQKDLEKADLLVSFSSTVIEEAMLNKIPVLLYDKWRRYQHFDALDLDKDLFRPYPVYYISSAPVMEKYLSLILSNGLVEKVNVKDWLHYSYSSAHQEGFYKYLEDCFH